jgi:hypothetical protein
MTIGWAERASRVAMSVTGTSNGCDVCRGICEFSLGSFGGTTEIIAANNAVSDGRPEPSLKKHCGIIHGLNSGVPGAYR